MGFYDDMQAVATDVLKEFKQGTVVYIAVTPGNGPVDNPGQPTKTRTEVYAAVRGIKFKYVQVSLAVASDLQVTIAVDPAIVPKMTDFIEVDGVIYKIIQVLPKPAAGTVVAHVLIIRK